VSTSRQYELVYIVTPEATEQEIADLHTQIEQIVERFGGTFDKTENWGRKRLAYDIGHHREGNYVVETITGSGELMKEIDRRLKVTEGLLRHLIVRVDESSIKAERMRSKRTEESRRRRVARGLPPDRQPGEGPQGENEDDSGDLMFDGADMEA
jgi:small subunit ribosomal protein S6